MSLTGLVPASLTRFDTDRAGFARDLGRSFETFGFAIVTDHGIDPDLIARANADMKAFFALPEAAKRAYLVPGGGGQRGYTAFGTENAKGAATADLKEFWHVGREFAPGALRGGVSSANLVPAEIPGWEANVHGLYDALDALGLRILRAIAIHLGLADDFFDAGVTGGNSVLRLLHYPPVLNPTGAVRAGAHADINTITLLLGAEEAGLQLLDRDGRWLDVAPPEGAVVVNIGDMLQRMTNHVLPSTVHRVVNPAPERAHLPRYSTPFFLHFRPEVVISTLPGCVSPDNPDRYPTPITADDFLHERLVDIGLVKA
jgi:isopenicillin N synthase-like dioxygenase